jgi:hypothetical protein
MAALVAEPTAIWVTAASESGTGLNLVAVVPSPTSPWSFVP